MQLRDLLFADFSAGPFYGDEHGDYDDEPLVIVDPVNCMVVAVIPRRPPPSRQQRLPSRNHTANRGRRSGFWRAALGGWLERLCPVARADHDGWEHS